MAATPKNHTLLLQDGAGKTKNISVYDSDVANAFATLDMSAKAGTASLNFITFPFPVRISDFSCTTGTADTTVLQVFINGVPTGDIIDKVTYVSTSANRPPLSVVVPAGARLQIKELA